MNKVTGEEIANLQVTQPYVRRKAVHIMPEAKEIKDKVMRESIHSDWECQGTHINGSNPKKQKPQNWSQIHTKQPTRK